MLLEGSLKLAQQPQEQTDVMNGFKVVQGILVVVVLEGSVSFGTTKEQADVVNGSESSSRYSGSCVIGRESVASRTTIRTS